VRLWRLGASPSEPREPIILSGHSAPVTVVRFGGEGHWLASAAADGSLNLWDLASPLLRQTSLRGHDLSVTALRFSPEAEPSHLLSWGRGEPAQLWRLPDPGADPVVLRAPVGPLVMGTAVSADAAGSHRLARTMTGSPCGLPGTCVRPRTCWVCRDSHAQSRSAPTVGGWPRRARTRDVSAFGPCAISRSPHGL
jgi:WD40 repeat protein